MMFDATIRERNAVLITVDEVSLLVAIETMLAAARPISAALMYDTIILKQLPFKTGYVMR